MTNYIQVSFASLEPEQADILIARLAEAGYEGFEEKEKELKAFISEEFFDKEFLQELAYKYQLTFTTQIIPEQNWNQLWESNFQPVVVDDFIAVRADFHEPIAGVEHEVVITPKMSFGTGHHATTFMMMQQMRAINFTDKKVFDFGTGTAVLAILAEKLGAANVIAVDNDEWSIANAAENLQRNNCAVVELRKADTALLNDSFDIILANINKNVILDNFPALVQQLEPGGILLLSGLLKEDETEISDTGKEHLLVFAGSFQKDNWLCLKFVR